jgi:hypothetical protein
MSSAPKLIYPTLNLLQYDLWEGLGESENKSQERLTDFYKKFGLFSGIAQFRIDHQQAGREFHKLLGGDKRLEDIDGFYYPVQIGDTCALQVNLSGDYRDSSQTEPDLEPQALEATFENLKSRSQKETLIFPLANANTLGQTWLLIAFVDDPTADTRKIAKNCDQQMWKSEDAHNPKARDPQGYGTWLGGRLFEFWQQPSNYNNSLENILIANPHVIIWLFPKKYDEKIISVITNEAYDHWLRLCLYRHKIFFAYHQSRGIKEKLKKSSVEIKRLSQSVQSLSLTSPLSDLRKILLNVSRKLVEYTSLLRDLGDQEATIKINLHNYQLRCQEMMKTTDEGNSPLDLDFLQTFISLSSQKYLYQIQGDRSHFDLDLTVLQNLNQSIQGVIQIAQAKNDKRTNLFIASFAISVAMSQLISSIMIAQSSLPSTTQSPAPSITQSSLPPTTQSPAPSITQSSPPSKANNKRPLFYETDIFLQSLLWSSIPVAILILWNLLSCLWRKTFK